MPIEAVNETADCEANMKLAYSWLSMCFYEHDTCGNDRDDEFLPARLIDLGDPSHDEVAPRLVETRDESRMMQQRQYITLSYCWGTDRGKTVPKTVRDNLQEHLQGISLMSLPKTFRDAMSVVKKLGYRYIWIDSLCIVQDDRQDFERECSQMHLVYSQAQCTIVVSNPQPWPELLLPQY